MNEGGHIAPTGEAGIDVFHALGAQRALAMDGRAVKQRQLARGSALDPRPVVAVIDQGGEDAGPVASAGACRCSSSALRSRCRKKSALTAQNVSSSRSP